MGTLGCINDMMRRDKENRELRKAGKERLNETRNRLIDLNKKGHSSHLSLEQLEEIRIKTQEKEEAETHQLFKIKLIMLGIVLISGALVWIGITKEISGRVNVFCIRMIASKVTSRFCSPSTTVAFTCSEADILNIGFITFPVHST